MADPILPYRASVAMEALRYRTDLYSHSHKRPSVYLLLTGNVGMRQARAQFSGNFFGCAGFEIITGKAVASPAEGIAAAKESAAEIVVICASDDDYALTAPDIHAGLKDHALVVVAGNPPCADDLRRIGLNRFIHVRSNLLETLLQFQKDLNIA